MRHRPVRRLHRACRRRAAPLLPDARSRDVADRAITTIEGIGATPTGKAVQEAWLDLEVVQCGYCQSGQIMTRRGASSTSIPEPTDADIDQGMSGNICRCGTYVRIREAIKQAAKSAAGK